MELNDFDAAMNGDTSKYPFCDIYHRDMSDIFFNKLSPLGNSLLHVAASSDNVELTEFMVSNFPCLITKPNSQHDTPLHVAARSGKLCTSTKLVSYAKQCPNLPQDPLGMKNLEGNTALHEALLALEETTKSRTSKKSEDHENPYLQLACFLVKHTDPEIVCNCQNNSLQSPLCLAVECGYKLLLQDIFKVIPEPQNFDGSETGNCLVHLMIERKLKLDLLELISKEKPKLLYARDKEGNTLVHSAASMGFLKEVCYLLKHDERRKYYVFAKNKKGSHAIHVASEKGYVKIMKALLERWPPNEFVNDKGQNILHVAAKGGNEYMVRCILKLNKSNMLINKQDHCGNTPLHLAARHSNCLVVGTLLRDKRVVLGLRNKNSQVAYDIAVSVVKNSDEKQDEKNIIVVPVPYQQFHKDQQGDVKISNHVGSMKGLRGHVETDRRSTQVDHTPKPLGKETTKTLRYDDHDGETENQNPSTEDDLFRPSYPFEKLTTLSVLFFRYHIPTIDCYGFRGYRRALKDLSDKVKSQGTEKKDVKQKINTFLVVATIIVGAAFAASVQLGTSDQNDKGGSESSDGGTGYTNLLSSSDYFVFFNTFAMNAAVFGAIMLCWAQLIDANLASLLVHAAYAVIALAIAMTGLAFLFSILLLIEDSRDTNPYSTSTLILVYLLHFLCFCFELALSMAVIFSLFNEVLVLFFYFLIFYFYYFRHRFFTWLFHRWF